MEDFKVLDVSNLTEEQINALENIVKNQVSFESEMADLVEENFWDLL